MRVPFLAVAATLAVCGTLAAPAHAAPTQVNKANKFVAGCQSAEGSRGSMTIVKSAGKPPVVKSLPKQVRRVSFPDGANNFGLGSKVRIEFHARSANLVTRQYCIAHAARFGTDTVNPPPVR